VTALSVTVVDLGASNTASMMFALERLGTSARLSADPAVIADAPRLILPGVGHAAFVMERIRNAGLEPVLKSFDRPLFGVCLGLQLLYSATAEGQAACLGRLTGEVRALSPRPVMPVPHMGWNQLAHTSDHQLLEAVPPGAHVYFVHSYAAPVGPETLAATDYGGKFTALAASGTVMGAQFHPERSGPVGARILRNFLSLRC